MTPRGSGNTPNHCFRCPDPLWQAAKAKAAGQGEPLSAVLVAFLETYTAGEGEGVMVDTQALAVASPFTREAWEHAVNILGGSAEQLIPTVVNLTQTTGRSPAAAANLLMESVPDSDITVEASG